MLLSPCIFNSLSINHACAFSWLIESELKKLIYRWERDPRERRKMQ
jgi:hypothetical protein